MSWGPNAPWSGEDGSVLGLVLRRTADELARSLEQRCTLLRVDVPDADALLVEIRRQIAEAAVTGNLEQAGRLSELSTELIETYEARRRLW